MANRQPGHHTFGLRSSEDIIYINGLTNYPAEVVNMRYGTVYDTTFKQRKHIATDGATGFTIPSQIALSGDEFFQRPFYTGVAVTAATAYGGPAMRYAKGSADTERIIGIVAGGTGPSLANLGRLSGVLQYSGRVPVLLQIGESTSARGEFLAVSSGVSGTSNTNLSSAIGQYGICVTNGYASGMVGITGLTGNYVTAFIRPVETE